MKWIIVVCMYLMASDNCYLRQAGEDVLCIAAQVQPIDGDLFPLITDDLDVEAGHRLARCYSFASSQEFPDVLPSIWMYDRIGTIYALAEEDRGWYGRTVDLSPDPHVYAPTYWLKQAKGDNRKATELMLNYVETEYSKKDAAVVLALMRGGTVQPEPTPSSD